MMIKIEFEVDNAAYRDSNDALDPSVVALQLKFVTTDVERHGPPPAYGRHRHLIIDVNGNIVGHWYYTEARLDVAAAEKHKNAKVDETGKSS